MEQYPEEVIPASAEFSGSELTQGKIPPNSTEAEQAVLGSILIDNDSILSVIELLKPEDFYSGSHQQIYFAMLNLNQRAHPIDLVTLPAELQKLDLLQGPATLDYLSRLADAVPTSANVQYYAKLIRELSIRRKVIHAAGEISEEAFQVRGEIGSFIDSVEQKIMEISQVRAVNGLEPINNIVHRAIIDIEKLRSSPNSITGLRTGFTVLDKLTSGLQKSDLIILAARPGMGKTSLALTIGKNAALQANAHVAIFSLEMSKDQLIKRLLSSEAQVDSYALRTGKLNRQDGEYGRLIDAASRLSAAAIAIDDTPAISILEARAKARRLHLQRPLDLIIVDYLQLMKGATRKVERRDLEISEISSGLKALAKELNVPIIALSQISRSIDKRDNKRPVLSDLRESGSIEQDADIVMFVNRDKENPDDGRAELFIEKHRNGALGTIELAFINRYTLFADLTTEDAVEFTPSDNSPFTPEEDDDEV